MNYAEAVDALASRGRFGISLGLERVRAILDELGRPETGLRGALIAGTNGKGSVVALASSALRAAGLRTGTMPKPHLVSYRERIAIDGAPVSERRFAAAVARVLPAVDAVAARLGAPTEFEALTAAAVGELARSEVDLAVIEVGLGGRLDATNVLDLGVAAITNVQHDHERHLGSTLAAIGTEKAAIIKPGNLAVTGAAGRGLAPIVARSRSVGAALRRAGPRQPYRATIRSQGFDGLVLDAHTPTRELNALRVGLLGTHQAANTAVALAVLDAMAELHGLQIPDGAIRRGFATARWPGRLEPVDDPRLGRVLLDGAHNPAGAAALAQAIDDLRPHLTPGPLTLVMAAMADKDVDGIIDALAGAAEMVGATVIATTVDAARAMSSDDLAARWRARAPRVTEVKAMPDPITALDGAIARGGTVVVAGSLYLVGAIRGHLVDDPGLRDPPAR